MKIAFLSRVFIFGGAEMSTVELAIRLSKIHEVQFFDIYGNTNIYLDTLKTNKLNFEVLLKTRSPFIVNKYSNKLANLYRYLFYIYKWFEINQKVKSTLKLYNPDVVIVYDRLSLSYLFSLNNKKYQVIYFIRTWSIAKQIPRITRYLLKRCVDKLICVSEATRHALYGAGIAPLESLFVVHNVINLDFRSLNEKIIIPKNEVVNILHSGGFLPSKGQHIALMSAKILKERNIKFNMIFCGLIYPGNGEKSKKYYEELNEYVEKNKIEENVTFVTGKSNILNYMNNSDILIFPSSSEGLPRTVIEAMILGKPVVANPVGGVTDLIMDRYTGFLTRYNDPVDYANYIQRLIEDKNLYNQIVKNAKEFIGTINDERIQIEKLNGLLT